MAPPTQSTADPSSGQDRLQHLKEQLQAVLDQQTTLQNENDHLREQVATLTALPPTEEHEDTSDIGIQQQQNSGRDTPAPMRGVSLVPTHLTTTTSSGRISEPKIASPEYYGGQRNKLASFITQVTMVMSLQPSRFPTELSKVIYAGFFLRDTAFLWFQPYVTAEPQPSFMLSFKGFCKELQMTFGDPDEVATAEQQLYALRQKGSVASYLTDFMRHAVLVKWNDEAKAARGLKDAIKDELSRVGRPTNLKDLEAASIRIDTRLFERLVEKGERPMTTNFTGSQSCFTPRTSSTFSPRTSTFTKSTYTRPSEDLRASFQTSSDQVTKQGKLTPAEYQRRKDDNLCLYCGDKGHQVLQCPVAPPPQTRQGLCSATIDDKKTTSQASPSSGKA